LITISVQLLANARDAMTKWWLTSVYEPQEDADKILFLEELEAIRDACPRPWVLTSSSTRVIRETTGWIELTFVDSDERWPC
jgi:hypothetical protein